jgi:hypothetical protein
MVVSVDFDGTCVTHEYPETGKNIGAEVVLKKLTDKGHRIICLSMRSKEQTNSSGIDTITAIKKWYNKNGVQLYDINNNPEQESWSKSRKVYANIYIDDQFLGCPLMFDKEYSRRPFVNWKDVSTHLYKYGLINNDERREIEEELKTKYPKLY